MSETDLVYNRVKTVSSGTPGRSISAVRQHYFVVDDPSIGESLTAADHFASGIAACAANHIELKARNDGVPLRKIEVELEARRARSDTSVFLGFTIEVFFYGVSQEQAQTLLESYKRACPLYKTVAAVTEVAISATARD